MKQHLLEKISVGKPAIIVITGDIIDFNHTDVNVALEFVGGASELAPIYYVTGNHEAWSEEYPILREKMQHMGAFILEDESIFLEK